MAETFAVADFGGPCPHVEALVALRAEWEQTFAALAEAQRERDELRYERKLLGFARMVLDRVAEYYTLYPADQRHLWEEAADIAQRIVDEIGHPPTDEPALGPSFREQLAEAQRERDDWQARHKDATARNAGLLAVIDDQRAELIVLQQFVEQIRAVGGGSILLPPVTLRQLVAGLDASLTAVDAYEKQTGGTNG